MYGLVGGLKETCERKWVNGGQGQGVGVAVWRSMVVVRKSVGEAGWAELKRSRSERVDNDGMMKGKMKLNVVALYLCTIATSLDGETFWMSGEQWDGVMRCDKPHERCKKSLTGTWEAPPMAFRKPVAATPCPYRKYSTMARECFCMGPLQHTANQSLP